MGWGLRNADKIAGKGTICFSSITRGCFGDYSLINSWFLFFFMGGNPILPLWVIQACRQASWTWVQGTTVLWSWSEMGDDALDARTILWLLFLVLPDTACCFPHQEWCTRCSACALGSGQFPSVRGGRKRSLGHWRLPAAGWTGLRLFSGSAWSLWTQSGMTSHPVPLSSCFSPSCSEKGGKKAWGCSACNAQFSSRWTPCQGLVGETGLCTNAATVQAYSERSLLCDLEIPKTTGVSS